MFVFWCYTKFNESNFLVIAITPTPSITTGFMQMKTWYLQLPEILKKSAYSYIIYIICIFSEQ